MLLKPLLTVLPTPLRARLEGRTTLLRAAENTGWLLVNQALRVVASILVGVWVARYLGPTEYGMFSFAIAYTGLFTVVVGLGLDQINLRDLAVEHDRRHLILGSAFGMQLLVALLIVALSLGIAFWWQGNSIVQLQLIAIVSLLTLLRPFYILEVWFQSQHAAHKTAVAGAISIGLMALTRVALILLNANVQAFAIILVLEQTANLLVMLYFYQRSQESLFRWRFQLGQGLRAAREGLPFMLSYLALNAYTKGHQIMVNALLGATANGYFAAALRVNDLWLLVPIAVASSAMPVISQAKVSGVQAYEHKMVVLLRIAGTVCLIGGLGINLAAPLAIELLYGPAYARSAQILVLLTWVALPSALQMGANAWIVNEGLGRVALEKAVSQAVIIVALNFWMLPRFNAEGAAISQLVASTLVNVVWDFFDPRLARLNRIKLHAWLPFWFELPSARLPVMAEAVAGQPSNPAGLGEP